MRKRAIAELRRHVKLLAYAQQLIVNGHHGLAAEVVEKIRMALAAMAAEAEEENKEWFFRHRDREKGRLREFITRK